MVSSDTSLKLDDLLYEMAESIGHENAISFLKQLPSCSDENISYITEDLIGLHLNNTSSDFGKLPLAEQSNLIKLNKNRIFSLAADSMQSNTVSFEHGILWVNTMNIRNTPEKIIRNALQQALSKCVRRAR